MKTQNDLPDPEFKRLRSGFISLPNGDQYPLYSEYCMKADYKKIQAERDQLREQVGELVKAMERIADYDAPDARSMIDIARAALAKAK